VPLGPTSATISDRIQTRKAIPLATWPLRPQLAESHQRHRAALRKTKFKYLSLDP